MGDRDPNGEGDRAISRSGDLGRGRKYAAKSTKSASEGGTESGIRSEVAGITWSAFEAEVGDIVAIDLQYRLHRVAQWSEDGDRDGERDEGQKGRTQDRDSSDGYARLREVRPLERAPKPRSDTGVLNGEPFSSSPRNPGRLLTEQYVSYAPNLNVPISVRKLLFLCHPFHCVDHVTVNLDELLKNHREDILAIYHGGLVTDNQDNGTSQYGTRCKLRTKSNRLFSEHSERSTTAKKRRLNVQHIPTWVGIASGIAPPPGPSSSSNMSSNISSVEAISIVSELLSSGGIPRVKFDSLFMLCDGCRRVIPKIGQANHGCVIDITSSDSELDDDVNLILAN